MTLDPRSTSRRRLLAAGFGSAATAGLGTFTGSALAQVVGEFEQPFANGSRKLEAFPEKRPMMVLTTRPPQLETPFAVFNEGVLTPNDAFFVRYHNNGLPTSIDPDTYVIKIGGNAAGKSFQVTPRRPEDASTSRSRSSPSTSARATAGPSSIRASPAASRATARWATPAGSGFACGTFWPRREIKDSAKQVTFDGLDNALFGGGDFVKALDMNQAMDPDVLIAYQMNGADLPMLNGYPVASSFPGYYGTYWVKHLSQIDVIDNVFEGFWMRPGYRVPDNDCACVVPGTAPAQTRPIGRFTVRSFVTSLSEGQRIRTGQQTVVRGIAFDGGQGIRQVGVSVDGGKTWNSAFLGDDLGRYSFREFTYGFTPEHAGPIDIRTCAWSRSGEGAADDRRSGSPPATCATSSSRSRSWPSETRNQNMHSLKTLRLVAAAAVLACGTAWVAAAPKTMTLPRRHGAAAAERPARLCQGTGQLHDLPLGRVHAVPAAECRPPLLGRDDQAHEGGLQGAARRRRHPGHRRLPDRDLRHAKALGCVGAWRGSRRSRRGSSADLPCAG